MNEKATQALAAAVKLLAAYDEAVASYQDEDGDVTDFYCYDEMRADYGEDALDALQHLVDALTDAERPVTGWDASDEDVAMRQDPGDHYHA